MKERTVQNTSDYSMNNVQVLEKQDNSLKGLVVLLNCKTLPDLEIENNQVVKKIELNHKVNNLEVKDNDGNDFESAIAATEFGKFNWLILFSAMWGYMSCMYTTTSMSLILPSAECDLKLTNFDKGMLNSTIYIGMTISAFFWGLLSDAIGRRNVLMTAFALDAFFSIFVALAQNFTFLFLGKLFTGFISSGPIAILSSFLAENHANTRRSSVLLFSGILTSAATITLPLLAWLIIPLPIHVTLFNGYISLPSWRIFLLVTVLPSVLAFTCLLFLNESPKFLMFQGKNEEALNVFKKIYKMNTGKPKDTFPVKYLKNEMGSDQLDMQGKEVSVKQTIVIGWKQMATLYRRPYITMALLPCFIQFCTLLGVNTIRLWSPQLFASAIERENHASNSTEISSICELLGPSSTEQSEEDFEPCGENYTGVSDKVYFNSMITGLVTAVGYLISAYLVKTVDKKWLMISTYVLSIACCFGLYWSTTSGYMLGVISVYTAVISTSATAVISAVIDIFPTSLRTTAVSLCLTFGRSGALVGNLVFPLLLDWHCVAPFLVLALVLLTAATLSCFLPKTKEKHLE